MNIWGGEDIIKKWVLPCSLHCVRSHFVVECFIPLNKQAKRLCHVSRGLPNPSLTCGNMYSGQRYQVFPQDPVSLQPFWVQTCKLARVLQSAQSKYHAWRRMSAHLCAHLHPLSTWGWPNITASMEHLLTSKTKEDLGNAPVIHHLFSLA